MANTIGTAYIQIEPSTEGIGGKIGSALNSEMGSAGTSAGSKFASAFGGAAKVAGVAMATATAAVGAFAKSSIDAGMTFDSAMSQVAATMGMAIDENGRYIKDGEDMTETMQQLRDFAQEMGSTTAFSASEAAEALNYMALAGYEADTSMATLPSVLNLAAAGGIGLADASDMVTDALSAFGKDSDYASTMVDQMALTASRSNTSVAQLGEAFLTIGANAKNLSGGTQELSTMLGVLADNGIKGSEAGTHLRNIMLSLNPTTDKAVEAWDSLGISAYDADGKLRPLQDTFGDINKAMEGMTDQEKTNTLTKMFNKTDLASINALLATEADRFTSLSQAIGEAGGSAEDMAGVQLENLAGDITLFQSALEGAKIAVSDQLTPSLREFVQFGSDGLARLTESFKSGGLSGAMAEFGTILAEGLNQITSMMPSFVNAGMQLLGALGQGIIDNLPVLIDSALQVTNMLVGYLLDNIGTIIEAGLQIIVQLGLGIAQALPELIPRVTEVILTITTYLLEHIDILIDCAFQLMAGLAKGIAMSLPTILAALPAIGTGINNAILSFATYTYEAGKKLISMCADGIKANISLVVNKAREVGNAIKTALEAKVKEFLAIGRDIVTGIWDGIKDKTQWIKNQITEWVGDVVSFMKRVFKIGSPSRLMANEIGKWLPAGIAMGIDNNMGVLDDAVTDMTDAVALGTIATSASMDASTYNSSMYGNVSSATAQAGDVYGLLATYLPMLSQGNNVNVTLEGDAERLFRMTQSQASRYTRMTGQPAFV